MTHALQQHLQHLLGPVPAQALPLLTAARPQAMGSGQALLREGGCWNNLWWVSSGAFRLYYLDRQGNASNKNFYLDGALFWPITPLLTHEPVAFWVEALEAGEVWALPWSDWQTTTIGWAAWEAFERSALAALLQDKMERERQFLQCTATQRYQHLLATHPDWARRIPLRHLASYLGITDVALSRIRRRLNPG